jgi:CRP-like cAMP-binding protein
MPHNRQTISEFAGSINVAGLPLIASDAGIAGWSTQRHAVAEIARPVRQRLEALGVTATADLDAFWKLIKVRNKSLRGQAIIGGGRSAKHFAVLLEGVAGFSTRHEDGVRQIHTFHYPGDILGLQSVVFPRSAESSEVQALTSCAIGVIDRDALDQVVHRHPALGRALWRAAVMDVGIFRQRLVDSRRPALQRVAHLLCEQMARLGISKGVIPLTQTDLADAAGLSVVHINRVFQELRQLGVLANQRLIEIANCARLQELGAFDAGYLNASQSLSQWDLRIDD